MNKISQKYLPSILACSACLTLGILSGYLSGSGDTIWYAHLQKPSFNPPSWIFGPVWTVLYIMMGIVFVEIYRLKKPLLISLFLFQFALNLCWSFLFFYYHRIDLALVDISLMWGSILIFLILSRKIPRAFWLFIPYLLWVSFAWLLNYSTLMLN